MYFIFDCQGNIVGNPKGYRTTTKAVTQQNMHGSAANTAIWLAYSMTHNDSRFYGPGFWALSSIRFIKA